ncbi:MAG: hypothetical protein DI532_02385 [Azospirillum brasilense]|nr:MAG: hypothetical protein DI532_02385 [Azospirillum brasilense]
MQDRDPSADPPAAPPERPRAATEIERQERLARALRENLRRRKAQGRARATQETAPGTMPDAAAAKPETGAGASPAPTGTGDGDEVEKPGTRPCARATDSGG